MSQPTEQPLGETSTSYRKLLASNPNQPALWNELGLLEFRSARFQESAAAFREVIARQAGNAAAWRSLGDALAGAKRLEEAIAVYRQSLSLQPGSIETNNNLGIAFQSAGRLDEAIAAFGRAASIDPSAYQPLCNLGNALKLAARLEQAVTVLRQAVSLAPGSAEANNSLGAAIELQGRFDESIAAYRQAISIDPESASPHYNLGLGLLRKGDFEHGWVEYEWRWRVSGDLMDRRDFTQPLWTGEASAGKRLLLHAEQGLGDAIQFVRYTPLVKQRLNGQVILAVHPPLRPLFQGITGVDQLWAQEGLPQFDVHCPLLTLSKVFDTRLETIPRSVPYAPANPALAEQWRQRISPKPESISVGIAWTGRADHVRNADRSIVPPLLAPLTQVANARFFSLQKGARSQASNLPSNFKLTDWTEELKDFADTAALIENLDLIISVDTAVAHLAGAMGKSVWTLLPFVPDWRWMLNRSDSPWYPTMKLFRQKVAGNWTDVIEAVTQELNAFANDT